MKAVLVSEMLLFNWILMIAQDYNAKLKFVQGQ
jgi:hypothetical protein